MAPSFIEKPRIIPNESGTLITLRCKCQANPKPEVTWYKGTKVVTETSKITMKVNGEDNTYEVLLLIQVKSKHPCGFYKSINNITVLQFVQDPIGPDSGTYRCHVQNEHGESNANLNLNIETEPEQEGDPPTFLVKPRIQSKENGKLIVMDCTVKANPKPEVVWYHDGKVLSQTSKISWRVEDRADSYYICLELKVLSLLQT